MRLSLALVLCVTLAACKKDAGTTSPPVLWSHSSDSYMSPSNVEESHLEKDAVLLHNRDGYSGVLTRIDPVTGQVLWERTANWSMHPPNSIDPLWIVDDPPNQNHATLIQLDPTTGTELKRVPLEQSIEHLQNRLLYVEGRILALTVGGNIQGIDAKTGKTLWQGKTTKSSYLRAPIVVEEKVLFVSSPYIAIDARSGSELFRFEGTCCDAFVSPNGKELYVGASSNETAHLNWNGEVTETRMGIVRAVSDHHVVLQEATQLAAYEHGKAAIVWSKPTSDKNYISAIAFSGSNLFYFSAADDGIWRHDFVKNRTSRVQEVGGRLVIGTEKGQTGFASPFLNVAPRWRAPYLYVFDWVLIAYRLEK